MPNPTLPLPTDTEAILEFYSDAIVREMMRLDRYDPDDLTKVDLAHFEFCNRITDGIHLQTLAFWTTNDDQGMRFAGRLGLQEYQEMMKYECWS